MSYYDFSTTPTPKRKNKRPLLLLCIIFLVGVLVFILYPDVERSPATSKTTPLDSRQPAPIRPKIAPKQSTAKLAPDQATQVTRIPSLVKSQPQTKVATLTTTSKGGSDFYTLLKKAPIAPPLKVNQTTAYRLQVAALSTATQAYRMAKKLKKQGFLSRVITSKTPSQPTWFLVMMGPYKSAQKAEQASLQLAHAGYPGSLLIYTPTSS